MNSKVTRFTFPAGVFYFIWNKAAMKWTSEVRKDEGDSEPVEEQNIGWKPPFRMK
jgi:hypothetical protein